MSVSKNRGGPPKWMVKIMENPMNKWMIWVFSPCFWRATQIVNHPYPNSFFRKPFGWEFEGFFQNDKMGKFRLWPAHNGIRGLKYLLSWPSGGIFEMYRKNIIYFRHHLVEVLFVNFPRCSWIYSICVPLFFPRCIPIFSHMCMNMTPNEDLMSWISILFFWCPLFGLASLVQWQDPINSLAERCFSPTYDYWKSK